MSNNFWDEEEIINEIDKNKNQKIVIKKCFRQGKEYIDFRIYAKINEEYTPTQKGFNIGIEKTIEIKNALENILGG